MSLATLAVLSSFALAPAGVPANAARMPAGVSQAALLELSAFGEVIFLPRRNRNPFSALIFTQSQQSCAAVKHKMLDVAGYPKLWDHIEGETLIREKTATRTRYALHLDLPLAPDLEGLVEDAGPRAVTFHDVETGGSFAWNLHDAGSKCHMQYRLYQPPGKESPFVTLLRKMEDGVGDSAELSAALATARGYASKTSSKTPENLSTRARQALETLAGKGIALRVIRKPDGNVIIVGKRRVALSTDVVLSKIRNRRSAARRADFLADVEEDGEAREWKVRYFNGRVNFLTKALEAGNVASDEGMTVREQVVGGDIDEGHWLWRVRQVPGGSDVELTVDLDVTKGSYVLSSLTSHDTTIRDAARFQIVFAFLGDHLGGRALPVHMTQVAAAK